MYAKLQVGEKLEDVDVSQEGSFLSIDDSGVMLLLAFDDPTQNEIESISPGGRVEAKALVLSDTLFMMFKFGSMPWIDCSYHPMIEIQMPTVEAADEGIGLALTVVLCDVKTKIVKSVRLLGLSTQLTHYISNYLSTCNRRTKLESDMAVAKVQDAYTTKNMVQMAPIRQVIN